MNVINTKSQISIGRAPLTPSKRQRKKFQLFGHISVILTEFVYRKNHIYKFIDGSRDCI